MGDRLHQVIEQVRPRFDHVLLDTGAGISDVVLFTISLADEVLLVVTAEPTSLADAYSTVKVLAATMLPGIQRRTPGSTFPISQLPRGGVRPSARSGR